MTTRSLNACPACPLARAVFIGRQLELAELCGARTARVARRGVQALWGRCFEEPGAPPYWPWLQALRTLLDTRDDERLRALLGERAAHIIRPAA